jgi:uncharacterized membrane protein required for colicin V production
MLGEEVKRVNITDYVILGLIGIFALMGIVRGIRISLVRVIVVVVAIIIAYVVKDYVVEWLIEFMPFYSWQDPFKSIPTINILFYNAVAFGVIFIVIAAILAIITSAEIFDYVYNSKAIYIVLDKLFGMLVGAVEGLFMAFAVVSILSQLAPTFMLVFESKYGDVILERTPIVRNVLAKSTNASEDIYTLVDKYDKLGLSDREAFNMEVLQISVRRKIISTTKAQYLIDNERINISGIKIVGG